MEIYPILDWIRYVIVRLFIFFGILSITPILLLLLMEPLVYLFRLVEYFLPSSIKQTKPVRTASMSIQNLSAITSDANPGQTGGMRRRDVGEKVETEAATSVEGEVNA
ncbi:hypothetical protein ABW19_dt0210492 [Dactylella cylindrospora]|nr:hypothetical protein ABW19_dt0210492 [Dactylella cylindrospora]